MNVINYQEEIKLKNYMPDKDNIRALATFFSAFGDDTRLKIIILLSLKPLCVGDISNILQINQTTISHQLQILKANNIVSNDRDGRNLIYYIDKPQIENILESTVECI